MKSLVLTPEMQEDSYAFRDHCASPSLYSFHLLASKIGIFRLKSGMAVSPLAPSREDDPPERELFLAIWCSGAQEAQAYASDCMP